MSKIAERRARTRQAIEQRRASAQTRAQSALEQAELEDKKSKYRVVKLSDFLNRDKEPEPKPPKPEPLAIDIGRVLQF